MRQPLLICPAFANKKTCPAFLLFLFTTLILLPAKIGPITGVYKPEMIRVHNNHLYVTEGQHFFVFKLPSLELVKKAGRNGEGPGEFPVDPNRTIAITILPEYVLAESRNKLIFFSHMGKFIKEVRKPTGATHMVPIGNNFVLNKWSKDKEDIQYLSLMLYDADMKPLKTLYTQKNFTSQNTTVLVPDALHYCVVNNKMYLDRSPDGFIIDCFDKNGKKLKELTHKVTPVRVTEKHQQEGLNDFKEIPFIKNRLKEKGPDWFKAYRSRTKLVYPESFPAIGNLTTDGNLLYVKTFRKKDNKEEYIEMDLKGKVLRTLYLPYVRKVGFLVRMQGDKTYYCFHKGVFYYLDLEETDDDEEWVLHSRKF
ncbi:MAG: hypothetical protein GY765_31865 [bacterium]|nr:hypothetical protein [bacterium]